MNRPEGIALNGRRYCRPRRPTVVVCVDGFDPDYLEDGIRRGVLPTLARFRETGYAASADAVLPTFTNPNNMSIVTGATPDVHGIAGNYYLDRATGREVMVTDAGLLRSETILGRFSGIGVATAVVTAKDKLREALGYKMSGICFSAERADECRQDSHGIDDAEALVGRPKPDRYSGDLSLFVMDAGVRLLAQERADLIYLSLSDYVQHKHAPGTPESDAFHHALDARIGHLLELGATVAVTADHGMSDKSAPNGRPNVVYLEDVLAADFGPDAARVICPITDPFVRHHGALGSFVRVYAGDGQEIAPLIDYIRALPGIELVLDRQEACGRFHLPEDREADVVVIARTDTVIGGRRVDHDLSGLDGARLRSHGGLSEQEVPFLLSQPLTASYRSKVEARRLRNFDIFDFALNGTEDRAP